MFRLLIWIIFLVLFALFIAFNINPKVTVSLFPGVALQDIPLALVIIFSFILGLLSGLLIIYPKLFRSQLKAHQLEKRLKELEKKVTPEENVAKTDAHS